MKSYINILNKRSKLIKKLNNTNDMYDFNKDELITLIDMLVDIIEEYERRYG